MWSLTSGLYRVKNSLYLSGNKELYRIYRNKILNISRQSEKIYFHKYFSDNSCNMKQTWDGINDLISLRGRHKKGEGRREKRARRPREGQSPVARLSPLPSPSPFNACHTGYDLINRGKKKFRSTNWDWEGGTLYPLQYGSWFVFLPESYSSLCQIYSI